MLVCISVADIWPVLGKHILRFANGAHRTDGSTRANLAQGSAPLLIMELSHPAHRGKLTTM